MEDMYNGQDINCGMMLTVDYLRQCSDNDTSNNLIVFPVVVSVHNDTGKQKSDSSFYLWIIFFLKSFIFKFSHSIFYIIIVVESVRGKVQLNYPDAETGLAKEDQNRACTVMSNYLDKGK